MAKASKMEETVHTINTKFEEDLQKEYPYEEDEADEGQDVQDDAEDNEELDEFSEDESEDIDDTDQGTVQKKGKTARQNAIVELKREKKRLLEENRNLQNALNEKQVNKRKEDLKAKYVSEGYDEDVAANMAERDERLYLHEQKIAALEFKEMHYDELVRYPQYKKDLPMIMKAVETTGMTVEQVCRGLYGKPMGYHERARASAEGRLEQSEEDEYVSEVQSAGINRKKQALSSVDRKKKAELIEMLGGKEISDKRYLELKAKHNL